MPYKSVKELPSAIKKLPIKAQEMYMEAFNSSYSRNQDDALASKVAWAVVKKRFKKVNGEWVGHSFGYNLYTFELEQVGDTFIQHADDGNVYMESMLADTLPVIDDSGAWSWTEEALIDLAKQINDNEIQGGITHQEYQDLIMQYSHLPRDEFVQHARTKRKGIFKAIKAFVRDGKLFIKSLIDKRYVNQAMKFNKISIEALVPREMKKAGKYLGGTILGFALDNRAKNQRTNVLFKN